MLNISASSWKLMFASRGSTSQRWTVKMLTSSIELLLARFELELIASSHHITGHMTRSATTQNLQLRGIVLMISTMASLNQMFTDRISYCPALAFVAKLPGWFGHVSPECVRTICFRVRSCGILFRVVSRGHSPVRHTGSPDIHVLECLAHERREEGYFVMCCECVRT